tara:strand:+ start:745 stop:981 length:237 start_codon:yes stop_codon:yes gene_type:complete
MKKQTNFKKARMQYLDYLDELLEGSALTVSSRYLPSVSTSWQVVNGNWLLKNIHSTHIAMVDTQGNVSIPQWILEEIS